MTKKLFLIASIGALFLAGFFFLTPPGKEFVNSTTRNNASNYSDKGLVSTTKNSGNLSVERIPRIQNNNEAAIPLAPSVNSIRGEQWRIAKKTSSFDSAILDLLNDGNIESPRFALYLSLMCSAAEGRKSDGPISRDELREYSRALGLGLNEEGVTKSFDLSNRFSARCGAAGSAATRGKIMDAVEKARSDGSLLVLAPYLTIDSDSQSAALNKVLNNSDLASVWLAQRHSLLISSAENTGYFEGLNLREKNAVAWTLVCNFGGDCADDGITRLNACLNSYFCAGNSVAEAVANAVGKERVPIIAARANKLALDLALAGSDFFKPRPKRQN
jgi:hypothetical protein